MIGLQGDVVFRNQTKSLYLPVQKSVLLGLFCLAFVGIVSCTAPPQRSSEQKVDCSTALRSHTTIGEIMEGTKENDNGYPQCHQGETLVTDSEHVAQALTEMEPDSQSDTQTPPQTDTQTPSQTDTQTLSQTDTQTPSQTDPQTPSQKENEDNTEISQTSSSKMTEDVSVTEKRGQLTSESTRPEDSRDADNPGSENNPDPDDPDAAKEKKKSLFEISDEQYEFPKTLEEFGYRFNEKGQLRSTDKDEAFVYQIRDSVNYNQQRYEALGEVIEEYLYTYMEKELNMKRLTIPKRPRSQEPASFFFASEGAWEKDKMLILIHGTGVVRAGQWTRKLIINEDLETGSQIPYIKWGLNNDYGVVVLNTNLNSVRCLVEHETKDSTIQQYHDVCEIKSSRTPQIHSLYAWTNYIEPSKAQHIAVVAHSYGGICALFLANIVEKPFRQRVFAIGFTDSIHSLELQRSTRETKKYVAGIAKHWVVSDKPLNTELPPGYRQPDAPRVSSGTTKHEWTSHMARDSVFHFIELKYQESLAKPYRDPLCTYV